MQRKDKKKKIAPLRNKPVFSGGFRTSANAVENGFLRQCSGVHRAISFFSGCGGMDFGFMGGFSVLGQVYERLPFEVVEAYDFLGDAVECYRLNVSERINEADLTKVDIASLPSADLLIGGFPCQDFSSAGPKSGLDGSRGRLYRVLIDYMKCHRPRVVVGENVIHLARMQNGACLRTIVKDFQSCGYHFDVWNLYAPDYGVPQNRRRLFFIGVRDDVSGFPVKPPPTHAERPVTISQALSDLEPVADETVPNQSQYFLSSRATSGGGQGDNVNVPDKVAYCIRANARGRIQFHYLLDRRLTVRECARVQTFPDAFVFPFTTQRNLTLIGNAVPPILAHAVARSIHAFIASADGVAIDPKSVTTEREYELLEQETLGL